MLIWVGWGFLVPVVTFGCSLVAEFVVERQMNDDQYYQDHAWPICVAFLVAAIIIWPIGRALNRKPAPRELVDPQTGETFVLSSRSQHSFFFIPMEYWAPILVSIGAVLSIFR